MVCDIQETTFKIKCPDCDTLVIFSDEGYSVCETCQKEFDPEILAQILSPEINYDNYYDDSLDLGNCANCDGNHTVVNLTDKYFCAQCLEEYIELDRCHWCNELNTEDMSFSGISGCGFCSGSSNYD